MRLRALLFVLLLLPLALPVGSAQSDAFTIVSVAWSDEDTLRLELRANERMSRVNVSLMQSGAVIGLPDHAYPSWPAGETRTLTFDLLRDTDRASIRFRYLDAFNVQRERARDVYLPAAPEGGSPESDAEARLVVADARLAETRLSVDVANVGGAASGLVLASIEDAAGRKIGAPYYRNVENVPAGAEATLVYEVHADTRDVVVALEYDNRTERVRVAVRAASSGAEDDEGRAPPEITLVSELPAREAEIGRTVDYAVTLRNGGGLALVRLEVDGLPEGYSARFFVGGNAVPSLFLDQNQTRQVTLTVTIPNRESEVDRTVDFTLQARGNETLLADLPMALAVRGVGALVVIPGHELLPDIPPGGTVRASVSVSNTGSAPLFNVELESRRAYGWTVRFEPSRIERLDPGQSQTVTVELRAPDVIAGGQYSTDISARSGDASSRWEALAVTVEAPDSGSGGWLWLLFGGTMVGTIGFAAWRKRMG